jgi:phosphosulfolactate phosphohydrolase-like enzyme
LKTGNRPIIISIPRTKSECAKWKHTAVVIDVLRFSTTVCALLSKTGKKIFLFPKKAHALKYKRKNPKYELFSELDFKNVDKFDNSPYLAIRKSNPKVPKIIVTSSGTPAVMALKNSREILIGCFANLPTLLKHLSKRKRIMLVPASMFHVWHIEDFLCANVIRTALQEKKNMAKKAIAELSKSHRVKQFLQTPPTAKQDLKIAFSVGNFKVLPKAKIKGDSATVANLKK